MNKQLTRIFRNIIPQLNRFENKKGDHGRIAVIGGSFQFTGAPYYSALSALKIGADMSHIFCAKSAAIPIKSYSPEIIVHPVFTLSGELSYIVSEQQMKEMHLQWIERIHDWNKAITGWVIGPGLGRDRHMQEFFPKLIKAFPPNSLIVFDADGIYYLCQHPQLFETLSQYRVILTPNHRQLQFLRKHLNINITKKHMNEQNTQGIQEVKVKYDYPFNMLIKGYNDYYLTKNKAFRISSAGGNKRCGGIGDILAGAVVATAGWDFQHGPCLASWVIKKATEKAYAKQGRGLTAPSIIQQINKSFKQTEQLIFNPKNDP